MMLRFGNLKRIPTRTAHGTQGAKAELEEEARRKKEEKVRRERERLKRYRRSVDGCVLAGTALPLT